VQTVCKLRESLNAASGLRVSVGQRNRNSIVCFHHFVLTEREQLFSMCTDASRKLFAGSVRRRGICCGFPLNLCVVQR
jgi:hypothetical protein